MNRPFLFALLLALAPTVALAAPKGEMPAFKASPAFEHLTALVGEWQGVGEGAEQQTSSFRLTSKGSALVETLAPSPEDAMVNVYHPDGDAIVMTHYCGAGNQPQLRCEKAGDTYVFKMTGITNWKKGEPRMTAVTIALADPDHMSQTA
jgi:hypothetical protein